MVFSLQALATYLHLARAMWKKRLMPDRDRVLILAGVNAVALRMYPIANYCRYLILKNNHGHMVRRWASMKLAMHDADFHQFVRQVARRFPLEKAESTLRQYGVELANERETYYDDAEYVAAIMDVSPQWLIDEFGSVD